MKKMFRVGVLALAVVLVTGCGSKGKVLTCTDSEELGSIKSTNTIKVTFSGDKATKINVVVDMNLPDSYKDYMDAIQTSLTSQYKKYDDVKGVTYKSDVKDTNVKVTIDADLKKMSDKDKEDLDFGDTSGTYSDAKKAFEKLGYTCK